MEFRQQITLAKYIRMGGKVTSLDFNTLYVDDRKVSRLQNFKLGGKYLVFFHDLGDSKMVKDTQIYIHVTLKIDKKHIKKSNLFNLLK